LLVELEGSAMRRKELLSRIQLYVIADRKICGERNIEEVVGQAIDGGAQMIQYRDKESDDEEFLKTTSRLRVICKGRKIPLIVNDRVEIALRADADGVHLGQEDLPIPEARGTLGCDKIIGKSAKTIQQAKEAEAQGADYVGLGPIFPTTSKDIDQPIGVDVIGRAAKILRIPFFPIGGISLDNLDQVTGAGGRRIAVISAVILSDDVISSAAKLLEKLRGRSLS
jgi:thiamine-phosphate pyrophosphorylase